MRPRANGQRGLSLVELMIALTLGMLISMGAGALLAAANRSYATQAEAAELADGGRYALAALERAVRQSAFVNPDDSEAAAPSADTDSAAIGGLDGRSLGKLTADISEPLPDVANGSDVLALRFDGAGSTPDGDGSVLNCAGFGVGVGQGDARGWSIFYVGRGADGETELRCKYRGRQSWAADAIVRGVDTFQVLYGLDTDTPPDGVANQYVNASVLNALDAALALEGDTPAARQRDLNRRTHWKRVASVKLAILLHATNDTRHDEAARVFDLFGAQYSASSGGADHGVQFNELAMPPAQRGRTRQVFSGTIALRNRQNEVMP